ncbi:hypothetical protein C8J56DRAFT_1026474 [Mycena floridula]|nr:hypothetical protein C8J56DRAFT_1026474 [Mycena floridula]
MPSFSLVRRFGKQHKATINSPVSSGLVEQHAGHIVAEGSHSESWMREQSQAGNGFSSFPALNSHGLSSGPVTLSPHIEGLSIRNINAPVMSNNHVNINNHYQLQAKDSDFAVLRVGDIYLEEEVGEYSDLNDVRGTIYKAQIMASSISIWSYCGERAAEALEKAYKEYASLPRHPNILQLYGICHSPHLAALVFHGAPHFMEHAEYLQTLPLSQLNIYLSKLRQQHESAHRMLEAHNLQGMGKLVIADFFPGPTDDPIFDTRIWIAFETKAFIKEDLLDYYKFLFDMISYHYARTESNPFDQPAPFQLSHPEINLPVYSLPGWNDLVFEVNRMYTVVDKTGMALTILPNMTIRYIPTFSIYEHMKLFEQNDMALFSTWACQANHLIHDLPINILDLETESWGTKTWIDCATKPINGWRKDTESPTLNNLLETKHLYLFCPRKSVGNIYWSEDEAGQNIIEDSLIQAAFGITVCCHWDTSVFTIPSQFYEILCTIHEGCGFDPCSTQIAEYLGVPLVVTDGGHSGLEEYVEDLQYTSESKSGGSDYMSASEDV